MIQESDIHLKSSLSLKVLSQSLLTEGELSLQPLQLVRQLGDIGGGYHVRGLGHPPHQALELGIDGVEPLRVQRQLVPDVLGTYEDGLEVRPSPLNIHPQRDDLVHHAQTFLPG